MSVSGNLTGSTVKSYMKYNVAKKESVNGQKIEWTNEWINEWTVILEIFISNPATCHISIHTFLWHCWDLGANVYP